MRIFAALLALRAVLGFRRIDDPNVDLSSLNRAKFEPYEEGFVGHAFDPTPSREVNLNPGSPFTRTQPNIYDGVAVSQQRVFAVAPHHATGPRPRSSALTPPRPRPSQRCALEWWSWAACRSAPAPSGAAAIADWACASAAKATRA